MPLAALIAMTAVWGVTFVQVKDAVALYPLFAFLAVRFAIATLTLAVPGTRRVRSLGRPGVAAGALLGLLLAAGYALQTAGLERTTVSGTGFITGMYVVLTPLIALAFFRSQIVLMERFAPRYDAVAFTFVEMAAAWAGLGLVALAAQRARGPARLDGVGSAARDGRLRERARLPRPDLGAAAHVRHAHRSRLHDGACLRRVSSGSRLPATASVRWVGRVARRSWSGSCWPSRQPQKP
jgi:hypothetical protein